VNRVVFDRIWGPDYTPYCRVPREFAKRVRELVCNSGSLDWLFFPAASESVRLHTVSIALIFSCGN
jgi:hypothetical protein